MSNYVSKFSAYLTRGGIFLGCLLLLMLLGRGCDSWVRSDLSGDLVYASQKCDLPRVKTLIAHGADVNFVGDGMCGSSCYGPPLQNAAENSCTEVTRYLLSQGANVNYKDNDYYPALAVASTPSVAQILIEHGGDVNLPSSHGTTPLMHQCQQPRSEPVVKFLLQHSANIHHRDADGKTALLYACEDLSVEKVKLLLAQGADAKVKTFKGETSLTLLHRAARNMYSAEQQGGPALGNAYLQEIQKREHSINSILKKAGVKE